MIFSRLASTKRRPSALALAIALAAGTAVGVTALEAPAQAQKKKKKEKKEKAEYSEAFVATYSPLNEQFQAGADAATLKPQATSLLASVETADDKMAAGSLAYQIGAKAQDNALQLQGVETMLSSGRVPAENVGSYNFLAGQLAYQGKDYGKARTYVNQAIAAGYTDNDPQAIVAETYFAENQIAEGVRYLAQVIGEKQAAGETVSEDWIKRGLSMAYNNDLVKEAHDFAVIYVSEYPNDASWGDAVAIALNTGQFDNPAVLDLLRLARRANTMRDGNMYKEYIETADPRRNPAEVIAVIDEGYASGKLDRTDSFVSDSRAQAAGRVEADERDLPALGRDARAAGAGLRTVVAAGDAYLSYGKAAEAEEFYSKALTMAGADTPLVLTRLGIAQLDQGKNAEAEATFYKVQGARQAIANLFAAWAKQQAGPAEAAPAQAGG